MRTIVIIFSLLTGYVAKSQDSLSFYLTIAANNNPAVLQKFFEYQAALQKVPQAKALPDPEVTAGVFLSPMELISGRQVADIRLMQMFPWFGALKAAKDEASLMAMASLEALRSEKLNTGFLVQKAYYELYGISAEIRLTRKELDYLNVIERLAVVSFGAGTMNRPAVTPSFAMTSKSGASEVSASSMDPMVTRSEETAENTGTDMKSGSMEASFLTGLPNLNQLHMEAADLENKLAVLQSRLITSMARLNALLNRPSAAPVFLPDTLSPPPVEAVLRSQSDSLLEKNPELRMIALEKQSLDARERMATRMGYPMAGVGLAYSMISKSSESASMMNGKDMVMPMVTLVLPVHRKKYRALKEETSLLGDASIQNYAAMQADLRAAWTETMQLFEEAGRKLDYYEGQLRRAAQNESLLTGRFAVSQSTLTDLLRNNQQRLAYESGRYAALVEQCTAAALLNKLTGQFID